MHGATVVPEGIFADIVQHIADGKVTPKVARTFALDELPQAQEYFLASSHIGSVVMDMGVVK